MKLNISRLVECREKLGITKQEAARRIGVSQPAYLRYEAGERMPSIQVIREIANVFHTSADYLLGQTDSPEPDFLVVEKETDPELFQLVQKCSQLDPKQISRVIEYLKRL